MQSRRFLSPLASWCQWCSILVAGNVGTIIGIMWTHPVLCVLSSSTEASPMLHLLFWEEMQMNVIYSLGYFQILKKKKKRKHVSFSLFLGRKWWTNQKLNNSYHESFMSTRGLSLFNRNLELAEWEPNKNLVPLSPCLCVTTISPCLCHP